MNPLALLLLAAAAAPPRFSTGVEQVRIDVVVSRGADPIPGLRADDFEVRDDGVRRAVEVVAAEQRAVHAVLVLDLSSSLAPAERQALENAAAAFLKKLDPGDHATLLTFTEDLQLVHGPAAPAAVLGSLSALDAQGTTALYDAVYAGVTLAGAASGRPFVLIFTDGIDQISWLTPEKLLRIVRGLEATVYVVSPEAWPKESGAASERAPRGPRIPGERIRPPSLRRAPAAGPSSSAAASRQTLDRIVADTGGRRLTGTSPEAFAAEFAKVLSEVKSRYLLVYDVSGVPRPGWHELQVRLKNHKGEVRARRGYFAGQ